MLTRTHGSRVLLVIAALATYLAIAAGYTRTALFDSTSFGDRAVDAVRAEPVRDALAEAFADELIAQRPQLIAARPVLISGAQSVLTSRASGGVISRAAADVHRGLLTTSEPSLVVDLADLSVLVRAYLQATGAELDFAPPRSTPAPLVTTVSDRSIGVQATQIATRLSWIAFVAPIIALLAIGGAAALAGDRRRTLRDAGLALMLVGALIVTTKSLLALGVLARVDEGEPSAIALAIFDAFLGDLTRWAIAIGGTGALLAAAAATLIGPIDAGALPRLAWTRLSRTPERPWPRAGRAALLLIAGLLVVASPQSALALAATVAGGYLALVGLTTLLGFVLGPQRAPNATPLRRRAVIAAGASALAIPLVAALLLAASASREERQLVAGAIGDERCNGSAALCDRRLDQIVLPTVHNANSSAKDGYLNANNGPNIETQLGMGIRGLLIDALAGQRNDDGVVRTDLRGTTEDLVVAKIGQDGLAAAQRLAGRVAFGPLSGPTRLYLCHVLCELGATDALSEFRRIRAWVERNPREVLMVFIQDEAPPEMVTAALRESGLAEYAPVLRADALPTLGELIEQDKRVVLLAENRAGAPWYPAGFELVQDTPFGFGTVDALKAADSCAANRGTSSAPMLLVNHWVETYPPDPRNADVVNRKEVLLERARRCQRERGIPATLLAIDFPERGNVVEAAAELNRQLIDGTTP